MKTVLSTKAKCFHLISFILVMLIAVFNFTDRMISIRRLPDAVFLGSSASEASSFFSIDSNEARFGAIKVSSAMDETLKKNECSIKLFGILPLKSVRLYDNIYDDAMPCGNAVGISIHTDGILVVGFGDIIDASGKHCCPARDVGIREGDIIIDVNGGQVCSTEELGFALNSSKQHCDLTVKRGTKKLSFSFTPALDSGGDAHIGIWARDSTIGIGTLSYISKTERSIAALGHAVVDADTGSLIPVFDGSMVFANLIGVTKGRKGSPGELRGTFSRKNAIIGHISMNTEFGVFGTADKSIHQQLADGARHLSIAFPDEVHEGDAYIRTQTGESGVEEYKCRIIRAAKQKKPSQKGLVIKITDDRLLNSTGGIVQGMSGSPIIQDGKLVGVVTHVFVNDPEKGYGIYAYWMREIAG